MVLENRNKGANLNEHDYLKKATYCRGMNCDYIGFSPHEIRCPACRSELWRGFRIPERYQEKVKAAYEKFVENSLGLTFEIDEEIKESHETAKAWRKSHPEFGY